MKSARKGAHQSGFTMMETTLAIAVGSILTAGATMGYNFVRQGGIAITQGREVAVIKEHVEQILASSRTAVAGGASVGCPGSAGLCAPVLDLAQGQDLVRQLPALGRDPYSGRARTPGCAGPGSCYDFLVPTTQDLVLGPTLTLHGSAWTAGAGSAVLYVPGDNLQRRFTVTTKDGSTITYYGYVVLDTDSDGNIVMADGGDRV